MKRKSVFAIAILLALSFVLSACNTETTTTTAATSNTTTTTTTAEQENLSILTSFLPMYIFTANIIDGVEGITLNNLAVPESGCLHDYTLLPADMKKLEQANIFIINGAGMEGFMDQVARSTSHLTIINASEGLNLLELAEDHDHDHDHDHEDEDHDHDHDHEDEDHDHDHDHEDEDEEHDHDHDHEDEDEGHDHDHEVNSHVWLSIPLAIGQIENITNGLKAADPDNADKFEANAQSYIARLEALYTRMLNELATVDRREMITFHEAFPYFAHDFNLEIVGVINREPGSEPTAAELAATIELVRDKNIKALFAEPQYPLNIAETIAAETGAKVYILDPIATGELDKAYYEQAMEQNLQVLLEALKD